MDKYLKDLIEKFGVEIDLEELKQLSKQDIKGNEKEHNKFLFLFLAVVELYERDQW